MRGVIAKTRQRMGTLIALTLPVLAVLIPGVAHADTTIRDLVVQLGDTIEAAIPVVTGLALLAFFFGLTKYIFKSADEDAQEEGKRIMIAGVISLFLIAAIGGIVSIIANSLDVERGGRIDTPGVCINISGGRCVND